MHRIFTDQWGNETRADARNAKWRVSAYARACDLQGNLLMVRPNDTPELLGLPGGEVNVYETIEEGLIREYFEETGYTISIMSRQPVYTETQWFKFKDDLYHALLQVYPARIIAGPNTSDIDRKEILESVWVPGMSMPRSAVHPVFRRALANHFTR